MQEILLSDSEFSLVHLDFCAIGHISWTFYLESILPNAPQGDGYIRPTYKKKHTVSGPNAADRPYGFVVWPMRVRILFSRPKPESWMQTCSTTFRHHEALARRHPSPSLQQEVSKLLIGCYDELP